VWNPVPEPLASSGIKVGIWAKIFVEDRRKLRCSLPSKLKCSGLQAGTQPRGDKIDECTQLERQAGVAVVDQIHRPGWRLKCFESESQRSPPHMIDDLIGVIRSRSDAVPVPKTPRRSVPAPRSVAPFAGAFGVGLREPRNLLIHPWQLRLYADFPADVEPDFATE
jgi:hypothetical protein